jgi:hypothetical protein
MVRRLTRLGTTHALACLRAQAAATKADLQKLRDNLDGELKQKAQE